MATAPTPDTRPQRNRLRPLIWSSAGLLLLLPAVAMRFTSEVNWTGSDFVIMGLLLSIACALYELGAWLSGNPFYRGAFGVAVVTAFVTVWVNLAVGMFGNEDNALNLMFGAVLLVAVLGALLSRFRAAGMALTMRATAVAQVLAAATGLVVGLTMGSTGQGGPGVVYQAFLTAAFALPWLVSAQLFRRAARAAELE